VELEWAEEQQKFKWKFVDLLFKGQIVIGRLELIRIRGNIFWANLFQIKIIKNYFSYNLFKFILHI
jgi:hypothetical protein